jgi:hypothetical protein
MKVRQFFFSSHKSGGIGAALISISLTAVLILWPFSSAGQQHPVPKLTLNQVEDLVAHGVPDSTMSTQIQKRGLTFTPNPSLIESLRAKGAGPQTLSAIQTLIPKIDPNAPKPKLTLAKVEQGLQATGAGADNSLAAAIRSRGLTFTVTRNTMDALAATVKGVKPNSLAALRELISVGKGTVEARTEPGAHIFLDNNEAGTAAADGSFELQEVVEGDHELIVRSEGYREVSSKFSLGDKEEKQLSLPLDWLGGYLSVSTQPSFAKLEVVGRGTFSGNLTDLKFPPGHYTAFASADGYVGQARTFQIAAGEHHAEHIQLLLDLAKIKIKADAGDPASLEALIDAVAGGQEVECNIKTSLIDWQVQGMFVIDGTVTVSKTAVSYRRTTGGDRSQPDFTVVPGKILLLSYDETSPPGIHVKVAIMNKKGNKENKFDFEFYNPRAAVIDTTGRAGYRYTRGVACDGCDNSLLVLYKLLEKVHSMN